jgi:hypothetical protein
LSMSLFFSFSHSPCLFSWTLLERERSHHIRSFVFMEWMDDIMLTSSIEA